MQNNSECCNNNCNQGRNCPLRAATPAADMGNPVSQLNQHVAAPEQYKPRVHIVEQNIPFAAMKGMSK